MNLKCWGSGWGLPSIDIDSLSVLTYAYFANVPLKKLECLPKNSISGTLPELEDNNEVLHSKPFNIINIFRREGYNADYGLTNDQSADILAYLAFVEKRLRPAILFALWIDVENYNKVTRPAYGNACRFPWSLWYPHRLQQNVEDKIMLLKSGGSCSTLRNVEKIVIAEAQHCLNILEEKLGPKQYFFGNSPTTFDAILYGHLGILLRAPLVSMELQNYLRSCDNLKAFCTRVESYFPAKVPKTNLGKNEKENKISLKRNQIISVAVAAAAMLIFTFSSGLLTSPSSKLAHNLKKYHSESLNDSQMDIDEQFE